MVRTSLCNYKRSLSCTSWVREAARFAFIPTSIIHLFALLESLLERVHSIVCVVDLYKS
jgi:hypothetical protein